MLRIEKFAFEQNKYTVLVSWDDTLGDQKITKERFQHYRNALGFCASRCYLYVLMCFDRMIYTSSKNGVKMPTWTRSLRDLELEDLMELVLDRTRYLEFELENKNAEYFLKTKKNDVIYATLKLKKILTKLKSLPCNTNQKISSLKSEAVTSPNI